jgi:hypothetical protein
MRFGATVSGTMRGKPSSDHPCDPREGCDVQVNIHYKIIVLYI